MKRCLRIFIILIAIIAFLIAVFFFCFPLKYRTLIIKYSNDFGIDKYLVASVINIESNYRKNSVSKSGAIGLMQVLPSTAFDMSDRLDMKLEEKDFFDVEINIKIGCYYLSYLLNMFDGNVDNALSAYNWGLNNVKNWIEKGNCDKDGTIINIPVEETKNYLKKYRVNKFIYKNLYNI